MKKYILLSATILLIIASGVAQDKNTSTLFATLENYNRNTIHTIEPSGRSWWQTVLHVCAVAGADIGGAYGGVQAASAGIGAVGLATGGTGAAVVGVAVGVVSGAGASYAAHRGLSKKVIPPAKVRYGNLAIKLPDDYSQLSQVGIMHNNVIHYNYYNEQPLSDFYDQTLDEKQKEAANSEAVRKFQEIINSAGTEYSTSDFNFPALSYTLMQNGLMSANAKRVLDLFMSKYKTCGSPTDIQNIVNFYIDHVGRSSLLDAEKIGLISALMVASESPFYLLEVE